MLLDQPISAISDQIKRKKVSPKDLVLEAYNHINHLNSRLNTLITTVDYDLVFKLAVELEKQDASSISPLLGIPFTLKDSYITSDIRTTAASKVLTDYLPGYNATVYQRLLDHKALLIGKANMDSWGHGASGENTDFGVVANPYDLSKAAGGSSAGSAVANACRMGMFSIGEDTGGSIRLPASWTNTCGLKVTYGRVSRYGCIAYASSFDTVGPMAKNCQDLAIILKAIAGIDPYDATSSPQPIDDYPSLLDQNLSGITIGVPLTAYGDSLDVEILRCLENAQSEFKKLGLAIKIINLPPLDTALAAYTLISRSETSSNLARYDSVRFGGDRGLFSPETSRRIMEGSYALSAGYYDAYYRQAQKVRTQIISAYDQAFRDCQAILFPVTPTPPTTLGTVIADPVVNILYDYYNCTQNPAGLPSLAIPCGFTEAGLPIGMQLTGPLFSESLLLAIGNQYQQHTDWHLHKPPIDKL